VHDGDSAGIVDRVHIMVNISDDTKLVRRRGEVTGVVRRRRWSDEEKGRIVAEAIAPGAVISDVARRHDLVPQHLWNWIKVAREGRFALPDDGVPAFVPVVSVGLGQANESAQDVRSATIELVIGAVTVRVPAGAEARDVEAVLRAIWRSNS
jgi:transposase